MRRFSVVVVAMALVAAGCARDRDATTTTVTGGSYPAAIVAAYLEGCLEEADAEFCACSIAEFQARLSLADFLALDGEELDLSGPAGEVIRVCLRDSVTSTTAPDAAGPIGSLEELIEITIADLEAYWSVAMVEVWGIGYEPPGFVGGYSITAGDVPECGGPLQRRTTSSTPSTAA